MKQLKLHLRFGEEVLTSSALTHFLVVQLSHGIHLASLKERRVGVI